jgi:hypothetical protein
MGFRKWRKLRSRIAIETLCDIIAPPEIEYRKKNYNHFFFNKTSELSRRLQLMLSRLNQITGGDGIDATWRAAVIAPIGGATRRRPPA